MKTMTLVLSFLICTIPVAAQSQWEEITASSNPNRPNIAIATTVYAFGDTVLVLDYSQDLLFVSTNSGSSWVSRAVPGPCAPIFFLNGTYGWALKDANPGVMYKTTNGGVSWQQGFTFNIDMSGSRPDEIEFVSQNVGYIIGQNWYVYKTTDGGSTFALVKSNTSTESYFALTFINENLGWVTGHSVPPPINANVWRTTNGGSSWDSQSTATYPYNTRHEAIDALDPNNVWCGGLNDAWLLFASSNAGASFQSVQVDTVFTSRQLQMLSSTEVWGLHDEFLIHTATAGPPFLKIYLPGSLLRHMFFQSSDSGWVAAGAKVWHYHPQWVGADIQWYPMPSLNTPRVRACAEVLNDEVYVFGGRTGPTPLSSTEKFSGAWQTQSSMSQGRYEFSSAVVANKIYAIGGQANGTPLSSVEAFDGSSWTSAASLPVPLYDFDGAVVNNVYYSFGGITNVGTGTTPIQFDNKVRSFNPSVGWTQLDDIPSPNGFTPRAGYTCVATDTFIYILGGAHASTFGSAATYYNEVWRYNPNGVQNSRFSPMLSMAINRVNFPAISVDNYIYAIGGVNNSPGDSRQVVERTNNGYTTWTSVNDQPDLIVESASIARTSIGIYLCAINSAQPTVCYSSVPPWYPVELSTFIARRVKPTEVCLTWVTSTETNNYGFEVQRRLKRFNTFMTIGFVHGHETTNEEWTYTYDDSHGSADECYYRLKAIDNEGKYTYSPEVCVEAAIIGDQNKMALSGFLIAPNPVSNEANVFFTMKNEDYVSIRLYDNLGRLVRCEELGWQASGTHSYRLNAVDLVNGHYWLKISSMEGSAVAPVYKY
jgi:hypothetical protein